MVSRRKRARNIFMVAGLLNRIGTRALKIERGDLGKLYDVNRFQFEAIHDAAPLGSIRATAITMLKSEGWVDAEDKFVSSGIVLKRNGETVIIGNIDNRPRESTKRSFDVTAY